VSEKATITRVGAFLPSGEPTGWAFAGTGRVIGVSIERGRPTLYGGYTVEELRQIARAVEAMSESFGADLTGAPDDGASGG
jgi:hypothetical protein